MACRDWSTSGWRGLRRDRDCDPLCRIWWAGCAQGWNPCASLRCCDHPRSGKWTRSGIPVDGAAGQDRSPVRERCPGGYPCCPSGGRVGMGGQAARGACNQIATSGQGRPAPTGRGRCLHGLCRQYAERISPGLPYHSPSRFRRGCARSDLWQGQRSQMVSVHARGGWWQVDR